MSRLNSMIKLVVIVGNLFLILLSGTFAIISSLIVWGNITALNFEAVEELSAIVLMIAFTILVCTFWGCCGAVNQIVRKGPCAGRRILCFHKLALFALLFFSSSEYARLSKRLRSIHLVISKIQDYPTYDSFETKISMYFNHAYFDGNCAESPFDSWIIPWIEQSCPPTMSQAACSLNDIQKYTCDTTCLEPTWDQTKCCPSEILCFQEDMKDACPYQQCRLAALKAVYSWMNPFASCLQFTSYLSIIMIIFTILLICYNPRDDIEVELLKTGVMTEEDVQSLRALRSTNKLSFSKARPTIAWDGKSMKIAIDAKANSSGSSTRLRKNTSARISPEPSDRDV